MNYANAVRIKVNLGCGQYPSTEDSHDVQVGFKMLTLNIRTVSG